MPREAISRDVLSGSSPAFLAFLERTINLSALAQHPDIVLRGRMDKDGFEYFGISYHGLNLDIPNFSGKLADMPSNTDIPLALPENLTEAQRVTLQAMEAVYNSAFHAQRHEPIIIGRMPLEAFDAVMPNCSDMPIRAAGGEFVLPKEYQSLAGVIRAVDEFERAHNPNYSQFCAALTVDTRLQQPHQSQRSGGIHTDGLQGERVADKTIGEHSYIFSFPNATVYYPSAYPELVSLDTSRFNMFAAMDVLTRLAEGGKRARDFIKPEGNTITLFDCYTPHEAPVNDTDRAVQRKFLRLTYTVRLFDRLGNSVNPHLPLPSYTMRHTPKHLRTPTVEELGI